MESNIKSGLDLRNANSDVNSDVIANTTINGSNIASQNGDINITSKDNTIITASKDTYSASSTTKTWEENYTLASSAAGGTSIDNIINSLQMSLGLAMNKAKSDTSSTNYNNSNLTAENGSIKINSIGDATQEKSSTGNTTISGANILADNVALNTAGDLKIESLQNSYKEKGSSFGFNLGGGAGASGMSSANGSIGVNYSSNKTDRLWVDNQTSIIGSNSVTINTGNNTEIKGALIANAAYNPPLEGGSASEASRGGVNDSNNILTDKGNLTINTKSLTIENIYDHNHQQSSATGLSTSIGRGVFNSNSNQANQSPSASNLNSNSNSNLNQQNSNQQNPNQQQNYYPNGSTTISMQNNGYRKEQTTYATVGAGDIMIGGTQAFDNDGNAVSSTGGESTNSIESINSINSTNEITKNNANQSELTNLNRNVNKSQEITKDTITAALNVQTTIDNRIIAALAGSEGAQSELLNEQLNIGKNTATVAIQLSDLTAAVPGTPVWASRVIDEMNDETVNNQKINHPAPNLLPGLWLEPSQMGRDYDQDPITGDKIIPQFPANLISGTKANPIFQLINHTIIGGKSATEFHDAGMKSDSSKLYKAGSILPYFIFNYYGAIGTMLDAKNWTQNSSQDLNNSNPVFSHDKQNE